MRYRLIGVLVWRGAKWYLRRRRPSARTAACVAVGAIGALALATVMLRRGRA